MIGVPPVLTPFIQLSLIAEDELVTLTLVSPTGALGTVKIIAPFAALDSIDSPKLLIATTLTKTLSPNVRENGDAVKTVNGIVHCLDAMIVALDPLQ